MSWEDVIKNVQDTPIGDMEQSEIDALRRERDYDNYDGRSRAEIELESAERELDRLDKKLDRVVEMCDTIIKETKTNPEKINARYVEMVLGSIRHQAIDHSRFR